MLIINCCVCPIFTKSVDWLKTLPNGVKYSSFKVENLKIFRVGAMPPCTPRSGCGEAGKGLLGKKLGGGKTL